MSGKECPICKEDIGLLPIIKAGLPSRIKCPHCKSSIKYKSFPWIILSISVIVFIALLYISVPAIENSLEKLEFYYRELLVIIYLILLWQPFELIMALYLRNKSELCAK